MQEVLFAVLERQPGERRGFLEEVCAGDPELGLSVRELLAAHERQGRFDRLVEELTPRLAQSLEETAARPEQVGSYQILRELGRGGMGTVFLAERSDGQFEHRVALKLLRRDLGDESLHRRFLAERQILARLEHPNIARLLDGGLTEHGRPYFVMEYVEGLPIDLYCDQRRFGLRQRLELFRTVCAAVEHAHRHLVVHRDLKAGNILVTGEGTVKLLDFGIAKLLDTTIFPQTVAVTETGVWLMTPDCASPEQVRGEAISTASDVYQLGVLLYELLSGHRPYYLSNRSLPELNRVICDAVPPRPSTVVGRAESVALGNGTTLEITPEAVCRARRASADRLRRRIQGDLDNIVLHALRKEPARCYGSVAQLSEDLGRHLEELPVTARPDTLWYRASRFARRNRLGVAAALAILILALAFGVAMALQAKRTARERDKAKHVAALMVDLFEVSDPGESRGDTVTAREILDRGSEKIRTELQAEPEVQASMMDVVGRVYVKLGLYEAALPLLEEALTLRRATLGPAHIDVAASLHSLGVLHEEQENYDTAEMLYRQALNMRRALLSEPHAEVADSLGALAVLYQYKKELDRVEPLTREALAMRRELFGEVHPDVAMSLNNLAYYLHETGDYERAEERYRQVIGMKRQLWGDSHPDLAVTMANLGWLLRAKGDLDAAESLFRQALDLRRAVHGEQHPHVARSMSALADLLVERGQYDTAEPLVRQAMAMRRSLLGDEHPLIGEGLYALASINQRRGDLETAETLYRESMARKRSARTVNALAAVKERQEEFVAAETLYRESWALYRENLGDEHPFPAIVLGNLGSVLAAQGNLEGAESMYREALERLRAAWGEEHPRAIGTMVRLGRLLVERGNAVAAEGTLREALDLLQRSRPQADRDIAEARWALGTCLLALQRYDEAERQLLQVETALKGLEAPPEDDLRRLRRQLAEL